MMQKTATKNHGPKASKIGYVDRVNVRKTAFTVCCTSLFADNESAVCCHGLAEDCLLNLP